MQYCSFCRSDRARLPLSDTIRALESKASDHKKNIKGTLGLSRNSKKRQIKPPGQAQVLRDGRVDMMSDDRDSFVLLSWLT